MAEKITALNELTEMQARLLLDLFLTQIAAEQGDEERTLEGQIMIMETRSHMSPEEYLDMIHRINLLHRTVGCADHCHDKVDDAFTQ